MRVLPRNRGRRHLRADKGEAEDGGDAYSDSGDDTKMSDAGDSCTGSYAEDDSSNGQEAMSTRFLVDHVDEVISVNGVAYQIPPNASNEHFLRLIKEIGTTITIPGLSEFLSASQADSMVPDLLALAVLCCIAGSKIRDDDNIRNRAITLEDLFSIIPWQFYAQPPTLNILELHLERQYGMSWRHLSRDVCPVEFLHHRLLERFKEPDVLEDIRFRLRLPVAAGPVDANDGVGVPSSVVATPSSKLVITLFREQPTSHTVLAVTTLRHNDCSTLFVFHHSISIEKRKALESRVTSIFNYVFQKSGVSIRSLRASFPQPLSRGKRKRVLARPMEEEVEISAFSAFQLAHAIVKEARETNQGQIKGGCTILERLASLRSAGYGNGGPDFIIPRDFPPDLPKTDWMRPWSIVHKIRKIIARHIRKAFLLEKFPARPESVIGRKLLLGRKLVQIDNGGREEILWGHEDLEYAAKGLGKDGVGTGQEHVFREMDANVSECFVNQAEDSDEDCINDTDLLINLDIEATADTAFLEPGIFPIDWNRYMVNRPSEHELDTRVRELLTPNEIEQNMLTQEDVDLCLQSIGPESHPLLPSDTCRVNILRYQGMHRELIHRTAMLALAFHSGHDFAKATGMGTQAWRFAVANSTRDSQKCLFKLFTDPRTRPLDVQALLGSPVWRKDMWDVLPTINVNRPQAAEHKWSVYIIRLEGIRDDQMKREQNVGRAQSKQIRQADQGIYVGSAQAQHSHNAWAGEALRLFKGHEEIFNLTPQGLRALRMQHKDPHVLYVHRVAMRTGAARTYYSTASFPVIQFASPFQARIKQTIQRLESDQIIMLMALSMDEARGRSAPYKQASQIYLENVRPSSWPCPQWIDLNRVLPMSQNITLFSNGSFGANSDLCDALRQFYHQTGKHSLEMLDIQSLIGDSGNFISMNEQGVPGSVQNTVRKLYNDVLRENGLAYENTQARATRLLLPILWGLARHLTEACLILGERNSEYVLHWAAVDWCRISQLAQNFAPDKMKDIYSAAFCATDFSTNAEHHMFFRILFPYKPNFDEIRGLSEMPTVFSKPILPPFPYLTRARDIIRLCTMEFLDSLVQIHMLDGSEVVSWLAPATAEGKKKVVDEMRNHVLQNSRMHIANDLAVLGKDSLGIWSDMELLRLARAFRSVTRHIVESVLVADQEDVLATLARQQIPATKWREILCNGISPYQQEANREFCDNTDDGLQAFVNSNLPISPTVEHPFGAEKPEDIDGVEFSKEDFLALREYRHWIPAKAEQGQATQNLGETSRRPKAFALRAQSQQLPEKAKKEANETMIARASPVDEGTQTIEQYIRNAASLKKQSNYRGNASRDEEFFLTLSRSRQKEYSTTVDWRSEEMRPFVKIYSSRSIKTLVEEYFYKGLGNKEDEKARVKTLVAGLSTFSPDEPNFKLFYKILRQSIAVATNQDANEVISIAPYFSMLEAEGKVIPKKIGVDFTNRLIAESGLSGVNWSVGYHALAILMENLAKETPKRKGGELLFNKLEATFYGERQQFHVRSDSQSGSLLVCPKCGEIFPDERALRLHSTKFFTYCQRKCKECRESDSPCDITRSVGACTTCRSAGMICRPMSDLKAYKKKPWQCGKCLWRYHGKSKLRHIEDDCIGRCNRCQELDLPCRVYSTRGDSTSNPSGKTDCIFCLKVMEQCVRSRPEDLIMDEEGMDS